MSYAEDIDYASHPVNFANLVGTYRWVWDGQREMYRNHEIASDIPDKEDEGFLTLSLAGEPNLENVCGSFRFGDLTGSFQGVVPITDARTGTIEPGVWRINLMVWTYVGDHLPVEDHELWVSEEKDNHKHPFVGMWINAGYSRQGSWKLVGKKQKDGYVYDPNDVDWEGLSGKEKKRLGLREESDEDGSEGEEDESESEEDESEESESEEGEDEDEDEEEESKGGEEEVGHEETEKEAVDKGAKTISKPEASRKRKATDSTEVPAAVKQKLIIIVKLLSRLSLKTIALRVALLDFSYLDQLLTAIYQRSALRMSLTRTFRLYNLDCLENNPPCFRVDTFSRLRNDKAITTALFRAPSGQKRVTATAYVSEALQREFFSIKYLQRSSQNDASIGLGRLFPELVDSIFCALESLADVIFFAVTCQRYYDVARRHIEKLVEEMFVVSWAGNRMICVEDSFTVDHLPPPLLNVEEMAFLNDSQYKGSVISREAFHFFFLLHHLRLKNNPLGPLDKKAYTSFGAYIYHICNQLQDPQNYDAHRDATLVRTHFLTIEPPAYEEFYNSPHILRNLVTREYIRSDAIKSINYHKLTFEHVLYARIAWTDGSLIEGVPGPFQGPWAGHRFDLIRWNNEVASGEVWTDVSDEAIRVALAILGDFEN
ncbi:hypothetical protein DXG01_002075 [Tephrocybe rancida]|nr:hypothetical protein DXG01_002075 [Tephrocybe rancida]